MPSNHYHQRPFTLVFIAFLFLALPWSCTKTINSNSGELDQGEASPIITSHEFPDVPVPRELTMDQRQSFVYSAPGLATGLMVYDGNVDYDSLVQFFQRELRAQGWNLQATLKYPRTMLLYHKDDRICLITMRTGTFKVHVEIWVAPVQAFYE
ncbi:MAG: hypothetical protein JRJ12_17370 [Deltaproteobacteria bacterium]|nr:hypothetical protein [Deltaproteobacteria bacterium]MBW2072856.1 hypothetical protein [Deltaproteobacteria bacterium]